MNGPGGATSRPSTPTLLLFLIGVAGLAFSLTVMFIEMRAVLDIGGSCADGGPYVSARSCPDGTWLMFVAILGGLGWGALAFAAATKIGGRYASVPFLAWPALFCSLGFNFLQYGLSSPFGGGIELGFLIPGVLFELMGGIPLIVGLKYGGLSDMASAERLRATRLSAGLRTESMPGSLSESLSGPMAGSLVGLTDTASTTSTSSTTSMSYSSLSEALAALGPQIERAVADAGVRTASGELSGPAIHVESFHRDIAGELERLAQLHATGSLTDEEFAAAKAALLR